VKLLFDQNISFRLIELLRGKELDCVHVRSLGLSRSTDTQIWMYAKTNGYIIVSKDSDFYQRSMTLGYPPKVIWIRLGNCSTTRILRVISENLGVIEYFSQDTEASFLALPQI